ncbi:hypothetical protein KFK09_018527 [Dendrobium nobile]|uniref:Reverse transcriptase zinc-binding domain-containing protein n=1 Tax=Dendrobium nobile TaxID=94219 RepID=A0A8T3B1F7_DENNO|nr:hypothetical protein KFK09_018527 [Dendrobium nobile]
MELIHKLSGKSLTALAFEAVESVSSEEKNWKWFEKSKLIPRVNLLWWRLFNKAIPTNQFLCYRRL